MITIIKGQLVMSTIDIINVLPLAYLNNNIITYLWYLYTVLEIEVVTG